MVALLLLSSASALLLTSHGATGALATSSGTVASSTTLPPSMRTGGPPPGALPTVGSAPAPVRTTLAGTVSAPTSKVPWIHGSTSPPSTAINGSVHLNGTLSAGTTYLDGTVHIIGSAVTSNLTETAGWADYGPTVVVGSMHIASLPGSPAAVFTSHPGSNLWVSPSPLNTTALNILQGNIQLGDPANGQTFLMTTTGVNITIQARQAGGFYSYGGGANINVGNASQILNYANSSGPISIQASILGVPTTINVAVGQVYVSAFCIVGLGCIAVPVTSITWPAGAHFSILGSTTTSGQGMTATMPDTRLTIAIPPSAGVNLSMDPDLGSPQLIVSPGASYPALVATLGRVTVSHGEDLEAAVTVEGTFSAEASASNGGTFYNDGGLTIVGEMDSAGEQVFNHKLQLGPDIHIVSAPGHGVVTSGYTTIDSDVTIDGSTNASGDIAIEGTLTQNATLIHIEGNLSLNGSMTASGGVGTDGTTAFLGNVSSSGDISLPHAFMDGTFLLHDGSFVGVGSTLLQGTSTARGWTWVNASTYSVTGSSWLNGTVDVNRSITVQGAAELLTAPGGSLNLNATVLMGVVNGPTGPSWTSRVQGSVFVQGASFTNGTSSFNGTTVSFPTGLKVVGVVEARGNVSVLGVTIFTGAVTSSGLAQFPGMSLLGTFGLSSSGGSVNASGTSGVAGNVTLTGILTVDQGIFSEVGTSSIVGDLYMTGTVVVTGDSTLSTSPGSTLSLVGDINLANAAHVLGNVNTSGNVTIQGSATLTSSQVTISGALAASGMVYSRGTVQLSGTADFNGPVYTQGRTDLPGLDVAGNYTLDWGQFLLRGSIALTGFTVSHGTIVANSTGYYVDGSSRIVGHTVASGSASVWGASSTVGYVTLGNGATLAGFMEVNGGMSVGGLGLSGTIVLPNDTATFPGGANITGTIWQRGLLTSESGAVRFYGRSIVNGTVVSSSSPSLQGPVIAEVLGGSLALTLGVEFFAFIAGLLLLLAIAGIELLRIGWKHRTPFTPAQREAVRPLRWEPTLSASFLGAGALVGALGGYGLGSYLLDPSHMSSAGLVSPIYALSSVLLLLGALLWVHHRLRYRRARRHADTKGPVARAPEEPSSPGAGASSTTSSSARPGPSSQASSLWAPSGPVGADDDGRSGPPSPP